MANGTQAVSVPFQGTCFISSRPLVALWVAPRLPCLQSYGQVFMGSPFFHFRPANRPFAAVMGSGVARCKQTLGRAEQEHQSELSFLPEQSTDGTSGMVATRRGLSFARRRPASVAANNSA